MVEEEVMEDQADPVGVGQEVAEEATVGQAEAAVQRWAGQREATAVTEALAELLLLVDLAALALALAEAMEDPAAAVEVEVEDMEGQEVRVDREEEQAHLVAVVRLVAVMAAEATADLVRPVVEVVGPVAVEHMAEVLAVVMGHLAEEEGQRVDMVDLVEAEEEDMAGLVGQEERREVEVAMGALRAAR